MSSTPSLLLQAGVSTPSDVDAASLDALDRVVVRQEHDGPATFQIVFNADESAASDDDLSIVSGATFAPGNRVRIGLQMGSTSSWLIDGVVTVQELLYSEGPGTFTYVVTGEDLSAFMRLAEKAAEWPGRSATQIVREILANYAGYGLTSTLTAPQNDVTPDATLWIRQQNTNDLSYIRQLGRPYGYIFALRCGATTNDATSAYWGPPPRESSSFPALRLGAGGSADVASISFSYDGTAAELFSGGSRVDSTDDTALAVSSATDWALTALAASASVGGTLARTRRFVVPQAAGAIASSSVDGFTQTSARAAARVEATIDGIEYGNVLVPASLLEVRGAGATHDGNYYIENVEHTIQRGAYGQRVTLSREGVGTTLSGGG